MEAFVRRHQQARVLSGLSFNYDKGDGVLRTYHSPNMRDKVGRMDAYRRRGFKCYDV